MKKEKKKYIRKLFWAEPYDGGLIQEYLEEMAAQGLMLAKAQGGIYFFEKCQPKKVRFQVDYFDKASIFDTSLEKKTQQYVDFCEECGWHHLYSAGKMQIFYTEDETIPNIETDNERMLRNMTKNTLLLNGLQWIILPVIMLFNLLLQLLQLFGRDYLKSYGVVQLFTGMYPFGLIAMIITFIILSVFMNVRFLRFYGINRKRVKEGRELFYYSKENTKKYQKLLLGMLGVATIFLLISLAGFGKCGRILAVMPVILILMMWLLCKFYYGSKRSRELNIGFTVVVTCSFTFLILGAVFWGILGAFGGGTKSIMHEGVYYIYSDADIPVTLEMMGVNPKDYDMDYTDKSKYEQSSFLAQDITYSQMYNVFEEKESGEENLPYYDAEIFSSRYEKIRQMYKTACLNEEPKLKKMTEQELEAWQAEEGYWYYSEEDDFTYRMLIKEDKIITIGGTFPDTEQARAALLNLYK